VNDKVYILLDIVDGKSEQIAQALQGSLGVVMADAVEGPPHVVIVMEAQNREQLAKLTVQAIALVETMTEHVCLLPVSERLSTTNSPKLSPLGRGNGKRRS